MSEAKPTQWNETHCEHCGESEGRHYVGRCYSVHSHKFYTPVGDSSLSYRQLVERVKELEEAAKLVLDWYEAENDHSKTDFYQRVQMCRDSEDALRAALYKARPNTAEGEAAAEDEGISREQWIDQAVRVYLIAGDTEEEAYECAKALCREQNWDPLQDDLADPYDAAMSDIEGRGPAPAAAKEPSP